MGEELQMSNNSEQVEITSLTLISTCIVCHRLRYQILVFKHYFLHSQVAIPSVHAKENIL